MDIKPDTALPVPSVKTDGLDGPDGTGTPPNSDDSLEEPLDVTPEYVKRLRTENADLRVKSGRLNEYEAALFDAVAEREASKLLRDPADFTFPDRAAFLGDDGYPSVEKIAAAVSELAEAKPYLARVAGQVGQGAREEPEAPVSLGGLLRRAAI